MYEAHLARGHGDIELLRLVFIDSQLFAHFAQSIQHGIAERRHERGRYPSDHRATLPHSRPPPRVLRLDDFEDLIPAERQRVLFVRNEVMKT